MNLQRVRALIRKEWTHVLRDVPSLSMAIVTPLFLLGLFGFSLTFDVDKVPMVVWDQSDTPDSRHLVAEFAGSRYFNIVSRGVQSYHEVEHAIDTRKALLALVIPAGDIKQVQLIADGSDSNTATIALGYAEALTALYSERLAELKMRAQHKTMPVASVALHTSVWYNPDLQSQNSVIPGLIAVIMMTVSALLTCLSVAREWEQGSMLQLLSTPVRVSELIVGKLTPYFVIAMVDVLFVVLMGEYAFHVPLRGSLWLIFATAAVFCIGSLSLGLLISCAAKNQLLATQITMLSTFLPAFLLSGFYSPISSLPYPIQVITAFVPARYFIDLLRGIYLKGVGLDVLYPEASILLLFTLVMLSITAVILRRSQR